MDRQKTPVTSLLRWLWLKACLFDNLPPEPGRRVFSGNNPWAPKYITHIAHHRVVKARQDAARINANNWKW